MRMMDVKLLGYSPMFGRKKLVLVTCALTFISATASAGDKVIKIFKEFQYPEGCLMTSPSCYNKFNEKINQALSQGRMQEALGYCDRISRYDTPSISMPETYEFCAQNGNVRKMGGLSIFYRENGQLEQSFYWAERGSLYATVNGRFQPHPDSLAAWEQLCYLYYHGRGTKKNIEEAKMSCAVASRGNLNADGPRIISSKIAEDIYNKIHLDELNNSNLNQILEDNRWLNEAGERARKNLQGK